MMSSVIIPNPDSSQIYEGGGVSQIAADELKDNSVAIRQLINGHNLIALENRNKANTITALSSEIEYLKTSPFIAIIAAVLNIIGSLIIGLAVNFVTAEDKPSAKNIIVLVCGVLLVLVASLSSILYPFARQWFNKKSLAN